MDSLNPFARARACGFAFAPSAPRVGTTHWASATELQRPKLRKDSHLLAGETVGPYRERTSWPGPGGPSQSLILPLEKTQ